MRVVFPVCTRLPACSLRPHACPHSCVLTPAARATRAELHAGVREEDRCGHRGGSAALCPPELQPRAGLFGDLVTWGDGAMRTACRHAYRSHHGRRAVAYCIFTGCFFTYVLQFSPRECMRPQHTIPGSRRARGSRVPLRRSTFEIPDFRSSQPATRPRPEARPVAPGSHIPRGVRFSFSASAFASKVFRL